MEINADGGTFIWMENPSIIVIGRATFLEWKIICSFYNENREIK